MSNGDSRPIREMLEKDFLALRGVPCEDRANKLEEIIKLYSDLMKDCRLLKEAASAEMEVIIYGKKPELE